MKKQTDVSLWRFFATIVVLCFSAFYVIETSGGAHAQSKGLTVTVEASKRGYRNMPVSVIISKKEIGTTNLSGYLMLIPKSGGSVLRAQAEPAGADVRLTFLLDDLPKGTKRVYKLSQVVFIKAPDKQVSVSLKGEDVEVAFDNKIFTRYSTAGAPNKPIFYPILSPEGDCLTRKWPIDAISLPGESSDHPHHRGLWFTHGSVNGIDFWSEGDGTGKTVNVGYEELKSGWVFGAFRAKTEWRIPNLKKADVSRPSPKSRLADRVIAADTRDVRVYLLPNGDRLMDIQVTMTPLGGALTFGDTKEGTFGLRLPDALAVAPDKSAKIAATGHIETSTGVSGASAWGKPAEWIDCWGNLNGKTQGVAIFDSPANLRHPQTWHTRTYGLFAVNPFGLHDFRGTKTNEGEYVLPVGKTLAFSYRLLFHKGDTGVARISEQYSAFIDPPKAEVRRE